MEFFFNPNTAVAVLFYAMALGVLAVTISWVINFWRGY